MAERKKKTTGQNDGVDALKKRIAELEASEKKLREAKERLYLIVEGTASAVTGDFFDRLTRNLARSLKVKYAFVSELASLKPMRAKLISIWDGAGHGKPFEYDLTDTPCEHVFKHGLSCFSSDVQREFPKDDWLREAGIESYLAIPLVNTDGKPIGHMGVMSTAPLEDIDIYEATIKVFAARGTSELLRMKAEERLVRLAHFDSLTALPNRTLFYDRLAKALSYAARNSHHLAIIFLDLDGFKLINDAFGHEIGDELLKEAANRLDRCVRGADTMARVGGDEFAAMLVDTDNTGAVTVVEKIYHEFSKPFHLSSLCMNVGISAGIAVYPVDGDTSNKLLKTADERMYEAKRWKNDKEKT